jgi:hypothetical protein
MNPITIDLTGLKGQLGIDDSQVDQLTETCVNAVTSIIYLNWQAVAKRELHATMPEYIQNIIKVDKGRFNKQIVLSGILPNMIEQGASPFDIKEGFRRSPKVKYTIPVYGKKGKLLVKGGDWYLTVPFRIGVPGTLGQAGFTGQLPQEVYDVIHKQGGHLTIKDIPSPYDQRLTREAIPASKNNPYYAPYTHKNSIYEGLTKRTAQYANTRQNTYGTFRRAGANSDPLSWIHKGIRAYNLAEKAVDHTDIETIVNNEITKFLETVL